MDIYRLQALLTITHTPQPEKPETFQKISWEITTKASVIGFSGTGIGIAIPLGRCAGHGSSVDLLQTKVGLISRFVHYVSVGLWNPSWCASRDFRHEARNALFSAAIRPFGVSKSKVDD